MTVTRTKRGRKSLASLTVSSGVTDIVQRQQAPHDLSDEEVEVWAGVVNAFPADWFTAATVPLLAQYCRHAIHARRIAELLDKSMSDPDMPIKAYADLLKLQIDQSAVLASLATKMRISQQSTTNHRGNSIKTSTKKPWE
jgi:hypothetical protein